MSGDGHRQGGGVRKSLKLIAQTLKVKTQWATVRDAFLIAALALHIATSLAWLATGGVSSLLGGDRTNSLDVRWQLPVNLQSKIHVLPGCLTPEDSSILWNTLKANSGDKSNTFVRSGKSIVFVPTPSR
jgi:hypothetical protein